MANRRITPLIDVDIGRAELVDITHAGACRSSSSSRSKDLNMKVSVS